MGHYDKFTEESVWKIQKDDGRPVEQVFFIPDPAFKHKTTCPYTGIAPVGAVCDCHYPEEADIPATGKADPVNHPPHYTAHPSGIECIQVTEHMDFLIGNAIKYLWRAGIKDAVGVEDLKKAIWYIERKIKLLGEQQ